MAFFEGGQFRKDFTEKLFPMKKVGEGDISIGQLLQSCCSLI